MSLGVRSRLEHFGAELVTHEDVPAQIDAHAAGATGHVSGHRHHLGTVSGEMQVRAADSTRSHTDQHLTRPGHRLGHVVPVDHPAFS
jgi:hypothetical protein